MEAAQYHNTVRWYDTLLDWFGKRLSRDEKYRWADSIKRKIPGVQESEIIEALETMAATWKETHKGTPDIGDVVRIVRSYRAGGHGYHATTPNRVVLQQRVYDSAGEYNPPEHERTTTMLELKRILDRRPPPTEAWDTICSPSMIEQVRELREHCDRRGIEYKRVVPRASASALARKATVEVDGAARSAARNKDHANNNTGTTTHDRRV